MLKLKAPPDRALAVHRGLAAGQEGWIIAPVDISSSTTSPVAELGVTVPLTVTLWPTVVGAGDKFKVVVDAVRLGAVHFASRFVTFTVPNPVAKSYPATALKAGVDPPAVVVRMPNCPAVLLLQFGLPPAQATELVPLVMSLKTQLLGRVAVLEMQTLAGVFASEYKT